MADFNFDFSSLDIDLDLDFDFDSKQEREFIKTAKLNFKPVTFKNALKMVQEIDINEDYFCMVSGSFIFGDFIEALCFEKKIFPDKVYITTLGMGENNVDSIVNLVDYLHVKEIKLLVSNYFVGLERYKLIPYMIEEFKDRPISVGVLANHSKICLIQSKDLKLSIFGSANLSSSNNLEQFCISHDPDVFEFCKKILDGAMEDFTVIDGLTNETIFENNKGNTGKKAFEKLESYIKDGE